MFIMLKIIKIKMNAVNMINKIPISIFPRPILVKKELFIFILHTLFKLRLPIAQTYSLVPKIFSLITTLF